MQLRSLLSLLFLASAACSPDVVVDGESGASSGAGGSGGASNGAVTATSTGTASGCEGKSFPCAAGCGGDWFPEESECINGKWVCPEGTVDPSTCPGGTCWGAPLSCEVCDDGWKCAPTPACAGGCPGLLCLECPEEPFKIDGCACSCKDGGEFWCVAAVEICCDPVTGCGDGALCVNDVCKKPVPKGCWSDAECEGDHVCVDAFVCPCAADCDQPDKAGVCKGGPK